jgi:hypothetical protein
MFSASRIVSLSVPTWPVSDSLGTTIGNKAMMVDSPRKHQTREISPWRAGKGIFWIILQPSSDAASDLLQIAAHWGTHTISALRALAIPTAAYNPFAIGHVADRLLRTTPLS